MKFLSSFASAFIRRSSSDTEMDEELRAHIGERADHLERSGMVLAQGGRLAALGIALGLVIALGITRLMVTFLYGIRPTDPLTFVAVSLLLVGVALLASFVPARRAMRVDPISALPHD